MTHPYLIIVGIMDWCWYRRRRAELLPSFEGADQRRSQTAVAAEYARRTRGSVPGSVVPKHDFQHAHRPNSRNSNKLGGLIASVSSKAFITSISDRILSETKQTKKEVKQIKSEVAPLIAKETETDTQENDSSRSTVVQPSSHGLGEQIGRAHV